jgi:hypothetical protein
LPATKTQVAIDVADLQVLECAMRQRLTLKQKYLAVATAALLNVPLFTWIFYSVANGHEASLKEHAPMFGALNLIIGVPLFALITEKWIRKVK